MERKESDAMGWRVLLTGSCTERTLEDAKRGRARIWTFPNTPLAFRKRTHSSKWCVKGRAPHIFQREGFFVSPPNNSTAFRTSAGRDGSRAPIMRTQSPDLAWVFSSPSSSVRSLTACALNDTEPRPSIISSEEISFCAVPPA